MKVGLVLGAGGVQGGAWLTGGLDALAERTGWDPSTAERIVGTSAGSMLAGLLAAGIPPWFMVAHSAGETFEGIVDAEGRPAAEADRAGGARFELHRGWPRPGPGSWHLAVRSLLRPNRHTPAALVSGWLPRGLVSTRALREQIHRVVPSGWGPHSGLRIVACDYATGRRVVFGREGAPAAELAEAVAASCAIPGFYRPVEIGGRHYVDGGTWSASNLDALRDESLDLVICLNPTSSLHPIRALDPREWPTLLFRREAGRRLGREARRIRESGVPVVLIQPLHEDLESMSRNLMSTGNRNRVIEVARRTVAAQLEASAHADLLGSLPAGRPEKVRRPDAPPADWPALIELQSS